MLLLLFCVSGALSHEPVQSDIPPNLNNLTTFNYPINESIQTGDHQSNAYRFPGYNKPNDPSGTSLNQYWKNLTSNDKNYDSNQPGNQHSNGYRFSGYNKPNDPSEKSLNQNWNNLTSNDNNYDSNQTGDQQSNAYHIPGDEKPTPKLDDSSDTPRSQTWNNLTTSGDNAYDSNQPGNQQSNAYHNLGYDKPPPKLDDSSDTPRSQTWNNLTTSSDNTYGSNQPGYHESHGLKFSNKYSILQHYEPSDASGSQNWKNLTTSSDNTYGQNQPGYNESHGIHYPDHNKPTPQQQPSGKPQSQNWNNHTTSNYNTSGLIQSGYQSSSYHFPGPNTPTAQSGEQSDSSRRNNLTASNLISGTNQSGQVSSFYNASSYHYRAQEPNQPWYTPLRNGTAASGYQYPQQPVYLRSQIKSPPFYTASFSRTYETWYNQSGNHLNNSYNAGPSHQPYIPPSQNWNNPTPFGANTYRPPYTPIYTRDITPSSNYPTYQLGQPQNQNQNNPTSNGNNYQPPNNYPGYQEGNRYYTPGSAYPSHQPVQNTYQPQNNPGYQEGNGYTPGNQYPPYQPGQPQNQYWNSPTVFNANTYRPPSNPGYQESPGYYTPSYNNPSYQPAQPPQTQNWNNPTASGGNTYQPTNNPGYQGGNGYPGNKYPSYQPGQPSPPQNQNWNNYTACMAAHYPPAPWMCGSGSNAPAYAFPATLSEPVPRLGEIHAPSFQWHVGIYTKTFSPYMQICGGSLVKADVVISAAHCFWKDDVGVLNAGLFAVAAGKLLRPWEITMDSYAQHSDVKDIKVPPRFQGSRASFQDDIAILMTTIPFEYAPGVQPICISFDLALERRQLTSGSLGTIAGWGLTQPNGPPSQRLNFLKLPYVDVEQCIRTAEPSFLKYITSDKICAGDQRTGRALCRGDSGGGLVYFDASTPYLRGIASTAPRDSNECNAYAIASFTHVFAHRTFLTDHVPDIAECEALSNNKTSGILNGSSRENITSNPNVREESERDTISNNDKTTTLQEQSKEEQKKVEVISNPTSPNQKKQSIMQMVNMTSEEMTQMISQSQSTLNEVTGVADKEPTYVVTSSSQTKVVTMGVGVGERGMVNVPVGDENTFVCNCFCRN